MQPNHIILTNAEKDALFDEFETGLEEDFVTVVEDEKPRIMSCDRPVRVPTRNLSHFYKIRFLSGDFVHLFS